MVTTVIVLALAAALLAWLSRVNLADPVVPTDEELRIRELEEALRLTQEYVGEGVLQRIPGWSWWDAIGCDSCGQAVAKWNPVNRQVECAHCGAVRQRPVRR